MYLRFTFTCIGLFMHYVPLIAQFTDVSDAAGIRHIIDFDFTAMGGGAVFLDFNRDGFEDLYVTGGKHGDYLYQNLGNGSFLDVSDFSGVTEATIGIYTFGVIAGDVNNDGCDDLFVTTFDKGSENLLLLNNCNGGFESISKEAGLREKSASTTAAFIDFNKDGWLDLYVTNYIDRFQFETDDNGVIVDIDRRCLPNFFYVNLGNGTFREISENMQLNDRGCGLAVLSTDLDQDGDQDIYLANDHGEFVVSNKLFLNEFQKGMFRDISEGSGLDVGFYAMGIANGDYDLDGIMDYYVTNLGNNALLKSLDFGFYQNVSEVAGVENGYYENGNRVVGWGAIFFDYDNDIDLDLYVSNGYIRAGYFGVSTQKEDWDVFYQNNGDHSFTELPMSFNQKAGQINRGVISGDYDRDGDMDFFCVSLGDRVGQYSGLFRNENSSDNHWLSLRLEGTESNLNAIGSVVKIYVGDHMLLREIGSGGSHASQNSLVIHAGLGKNSLVDSLIVLWPSGLKDTFRDVHPNTHYYTKEGSNQLQIAGCKDPGSDTYNPLATYSTACYYEMKSGCTDPGALNYDANATVNNGTCSYTTAGEFDLSDMPEVMIYPNPVTDRFQVDVAKMHRAKNYKLVIADALGNIVYRDYKYSVNKLVDISYLGSGMYFINMTDASGDIKPGWKRITKI